ncbi:uncharacterized protein LOC129752090 [Uranotaenia lowii]|uniref:uncharacterized protein LOC129752090 n=1 Tax=Uranotaenia lowii TaxID=190385 RepID=UPI002479AC48|nr:uncharacterized protein LOC129752090 [Uranotaenia lowii]
MKFSLVTCVLSVLVLSIECRPQTVQIQEQIMRLLPQQRVLEPLMEQRGSAEETRRILEEIDRINVAMGYKKPPQPVVFPRNQPFNEGYFFPRPVYQPLNFKSVVARPGGTSPAPMFKHLAAVTAPEQTLPGAGPVDPFRAQVFYYPAPYMHLPMPDAPRAFHVKQTRELMPKIYVLPIVVPTPDGKSSQIQYVPSTIDFNKALELKPKARAVEETPAAVVEPSPKKSKGVVDDLAAAVVDDTVEEELLDEMLDAVGYGEEDEQDEKQEQIAPGVEDEPILTNDKFINSRISSSEENDDDEDDDVEPDEDADTDLEMVILNKGTSGRAKSFNISATFQNFTNRFSLHPSSANPVNLDDLKEIPDMSDAPSDEKSPFGLFNRQSDAAPASGLVIQRLRVRQGGIAIAGPGGVATAGSGGTAIVGPNGTAITHPRSLTIAGPGAKIYAVPETVDLGQTINATTKQRSLSLDAVLVASGPVVYYRSLQSFPSPYLLAPGSNVNLNYHPQQMGTIFPYGQQSPGYYGGGLGEVPVQLIPSSAFAPHPFGRVPRVLSTSPIPSQATTPVQMTQNPIKLTDGGFRPIAPQSSALTQSSGFRPVVPKASATRMIKLTSGPLRSISPQRSQKKPKRIMSAPYIQALQQSDKRFKIQKIQLAPTKLQYPVPIKVKPVTTLKSKPTTTKPVKPVSQTVRPAPAKLIADTTPAQQVLVTATGSTAADQPIPRVPVIPVLTDSIPFYGIPLTDNRDEASLILEPNSRAVSGNGGTAISTPVSHAILKKGSSTKILFRPQSVAIVGANGKAHAQADLIVDYELLKVPLSRTFSEPEHRQATDVLKLPFYGGARGQILEIRKNSDGTVVSKILRGEDDEMELKVHQLVDDLKNNEEILAEDEEIKASDQSFGDYLLNIQKAAASLVTLQEQVKKSGKLSGDQKKVYTENLEKLGVAAQKLAQIQQQEDDNDAIKFLFDTEYDQSPAEKGDKKKTTYKITSFPGFKGKESEDKITKKKEEEENVGEEEGATSTSGDSDSVQVHSPEKENSIAEAKPVGLAIAGEGGVASSKPVATAVVGDGGLAVARPVATAIAGIKPSELGSLGLPIAVNKKLITKGKYGLVTADQDATAGLLVGPGFQEARVSQNEIEAEIDDARQQVVETMIPQFDTEKFLAGLRLKAKQQQQVQQVQQPTSLGQPQVLPFGSSNIIPQSYPFVSDYVSAPQFPVYTPYMPYYSWNPYNSLAYMAAAYQQQQQQQQLAFQSQYNPYVYATTAAAAPPSFQQYDYPQRAFYTAAAAGSLTPTLAGTAAGSAAAYPSYYNYPSYSTPSPYRFFYY